MGLRGSGRSGSSGEASGGLGLSPPTGAWPVCSRRLPRQAAVELRVCGSSGGSRGLCTRDTPLKESGVLLTEA